VGVGVSVRVGVGACVHVCVCVRFNAYVRACVRARVSWSVPVHV